MQSATLERIQCPLNDCRGKLTLARGDLRSGSLKCANCAEEYPILAGVAIVLPDPEGYILAHVKGIAQWVDDREIPKTIRKEYQEARRELEREHIEEDLESERVNALYFMTHYLSAAEAAEGVASPEIRELITRHWDRGPFHQVAEWVKEASVNRALTIVELGCGVGGLAARLADSVQEYLGIDSSFASVALARSLYLAGEEGTGSKVPTEQGVPADLVREALARRYDLTALRQRLARPKQIDFIVGDLELPPVAPAWHDGCVILNAIDMLNAPEELPVIQKRLIRPEGFIIQSAPYIWHESVLADLRPKHFSESDSAAAVEALYRGAGFRIEKSAAHVPWIFFKHFRQVELYSVHAMIARLS
jgi:SAM-dependent methyltransferase/uncharacterized protein YbaR (Trm112 family)